jgi:hypothetical protein
MITNQSEAPLFEITSAECKFGTVSIDGTLGYDTSLSSRVVNPGLSPRTIVISAHAPSRVEIVTNRPTEVFGFLNATGNLGAPVVFTVNDNPIGVAAGPLQQTSSIRLPVGRHVLNAITTQSDLRHAVWAVEPIDAFDSKRLAVVTLACYPEREAWQQLWHLTQSLLHFGMRAHVMGVGTEFRSFTHAKVVRLASFIDQIDAEHILFTDSRDSFLVGGEDEIMSEFLKFDSDFVVSMERGCWPLFDETWKKSFPPVTDNRNWPNGGGWIGTKAGVMRVLNASNRIATEISTGQFTGLTKNWESMLKGRPHDDQLLMQVLYLNGEIMADKDCKIFTNVGTANRSITENGDYEFVDGRVVVTATKQSPQVIHFSGSAGAAARDQWAALLGVA